MRRWVIALVAVLCAPGGMTAAQDQISTVPVHFAPGASGAALKGTIVGRESISYTLGAEAGQHMTVRLSSEHTAIYFNVYEPGRAPGDQALAVSEMTPEINLYSGLLPSSGEYTINIYLYRSAARRGETANYTLDISITGDTGSVVQGDYADGLQGGPDFFMVQTSGGGLNVRSEASAGAQVLAMLANGTPVRNLGCRMAEGRRWCHVATLSDPGIEGWAAGVFLVEGSDPGVMTQLPDAVPVQGETTDALVPGTNFHATGQIDCVRGADAPSRLCDFGVVREGNGNGTVTVTWPDGGSRLIYFENGAPASYDQSQADAGTSMDVSRDGDTFIVTIGDDRFLIPEAVILGG